MASITTRAGKGSALTHTEVDNNFTNLNNDKVDITELHQCSQSTSTDDYTRICRIVFDSQAEYANMVLRFFDGIENTADNDVCELVISARQEAALNSDPVTTLRVRNLDGAGSISHTSFAAYYSTVSATQSVIDIYVTSAAGNLDAFYQALSINNNGAAITFYDSDGTDTESNITGGTFDVTSSPFKEEFELSFCIGGGSDVTIADGTVLPIGTFNVLIKDNQKLVVKRARYWVRDDSSGTGLRFIIYFNPLSPGFTSTDNQDDESPNATVQSNTTGSDSQYVITVGVKNDTGGSKNAKHESAIWARLAIESV